MAYSRIIFPDRAENMRENDKLRKGYRVFLNYWLDFISFLKKSYERVSERQSSYALTIYGAQGVGKTLLADKLKTDIEQTKIQINYGNITYDENNLWHRLTCGNHKNIKLIQDATINSELYDATDDINWIIKVSDWSNSHVNRTKIVILDNAERAYFGAALSGMDEASFIARRSEPAVATHVAQQFIKLARSSARGTLFIILGNDEQFLHTFFDACESQHQGMVVFSNLPLPSNKDKETIVRINVNRLNKVSYWSCVDKSGPHLKEDLYNKLAGTATFPDTFNAVDDAFADSQSRKGRPANKCLLTLVILTKDLSKSEEIALSLSKKSNTNVIKNDVAHLFYIPDNYCQVLCPDKIDASMMLESEFTLRLLFLSEIWVQQLLGDAIAQKRAITCLNTLLVHPKIGQDNITRSNISKDQTDKSRLLIAAPGSASRADLDTFWKLGARRSTIYEPILSSCYTGYNKAFCNEYNKRPDILIQEYIPCAVLEATTCSKVEISKVIKRECHAVELTAQVTATVENVSNYLSGKINNYIELVKEL